MHERTVLCCPRCDHPLAGDPHRHGSLSCPEPYCDYVLALGEAPREAAPQPGPPFLRLAG